MVKIDFEIETDRGLYRDAILLPNDHTLTEAEIDALKMDRVARWVAFIETTSQSAPDGGDI